MFVPRCDAYAYKEAYELCSSYILSRSGNEEDARDIIQEAWKIYFLRADREELDFDCPVPVYIYGICRNLWRRELRDRNSGRFTSLLYEVEDYFIDTLNDSRLKEVQERILQRHLPSLSECCRKVIELRLEGHSMEEVANELGFANGAVSAAKFHKCCKRLKDLIQMDPEYIQYFGSCPN